MLDKNGTKNWAVSWIPSTSKVYPIPKKKGYTILILHGLCKEPTFEDDFPFLYVFSLGGSGTFQMQKLSGAEKKHLEGRTELQIPNIQKHCERTNTPRWIKFGLIFFFEGEGDKILLS